MSGQSSNQQASRRRWLPEIVPNTADRAAGERVAMLVDPGAFVQAHELQVATFVSRY